MKKQNFTKLKNIISGFKNARVMVIGDLILDEFIWGKVSRISPEAPVPVVWADRESFMPGGASNVANNIASLGGRAELIGVIGNDERGSILKSEMSQRGVETEGVITDSTRPTVLKTRVIAHKQQIVRIDKETLRPISQKMISKILTHVKQKIRDIDLLVIEDYGKGVITPQLLKGIISLARKFKKTIAVDPKEDHLLFYKNVSLITPNKDEASKASGIKIDSKKQAEAAGRALLKKLKCNIVLITLGDQGMALFKEGKKTVFIPTIAQEVYDVSGAGDTVIGTFALALAAGAGNIEAAHIANCAAGIVVGKVGINVVCQEELLNRIKKEIHG